MPASSESRFLIIETGRPVPSMRRHGRFPHWIRSAAGLTRGETDAVDVECAETLPPHEGLAGVIVTGSGAMVTERRDWSEATAAWLRGAAHAGVPVFGICYGHQLLAHALGGEVGDNPNGRKMGTVAVDLLPAAADDPLFAGLPDRFLAQATHLQSVLRAPEGATVLARSDHDDCHVFRWGDSAWGVQFHPEFGTVHMRGYVQARADALARDGFDPKRIEAEVAAAPHARNALRRFVRHARLRQSPKTP